MGIYIREGHYDLNEPIIFDENDSGIIYPFINRDQQDWITIDNHHEAIKSGQASKFDRLLYCGDCGRKMKKQVWESNIYYVCPKYSETKGTCSLKSWRLDRIINALI